MTTITPAMWQRMPWHARSKALAKLDREARDLTERILILRRLNETMTATVEAKTGLRTRPADQPRCVALACGRPLDDKGRCSRCNWRDIAREWSTP